MPAPAALPTSSRPRRRAALVLSMLAAAAPAWAPAGASASVYRAAAVHTYQDARGDVESAEGPASQAEADVVSVSGEHRGADVVLSLLTAMPTDPATHPAWAGDTVVIWGLSATSTTMPDFIVAYYQDESGRVVYEVHRTDTDDRTATDDAAPPVCTGSGGGGADGAYSVTVPAGCFESPSSFSYGGVIQWDGPQSSSPVADAAPEDGLVGPVAAPGAPAEPAPATTDGPDPSFHPGDGGYWLTAADGGVFSFGDAKFWGSTGGIKLNQPIVGMATIPGQGGYWFVARDGGIFAFGGANFFGSMGGRPLNRPIVGMAPTTSGKGYWLVASDGGLFSFGDARFYGSTGDLRLNQPIVGMAPTPSGNGYWMVAADGGVFSFGDAKFYGSTGNLKLNQPITGLATTRDGRGYWFVARDGGVFAFGNAAFHGNGMGSSSPVVGMAAARDGAGYSIVRADGSVVNRGSAPKPGSLAGRPLNQPITAIAVVP